MRSAPLLTPGDRPFLVSDRGTRARKVKHRHPLVLWHLLSLDAPTVASCWTAFVAWTAGVAITLVDVVAMFLAVWILYAADRLLDAQPLFHAPMLPEMRERHAFHHVHRRKLLPAISCAALPLALLLHKTAEPVLHLYIVLVCLLGSWLLLVHARPKTADGAHRLPKELVVGVFFPAAVFVPTVARAQFLRVPLLFPALLFGSVCVLNCLFLYAWEHPGEEQRTDAHLTTRVGLHALQPLAVSVALLSGGWALCARFLPLRASAGTAFPGDAGVLPHLAAFAAAVCASSLLLVGLHWQRHRIAPERLRALADFVLLTPVLAYALTRTVAGH